jgi:DNA-binding transcriptional LysR family regulator
MSDFNSLMIFAAVVKAKSFSEAARRLKMRGDLIRLLPDWYADAGAISLYYASRTLISAKTRVFVDLVVKAFRDSRLDVAFSGNR